MSFGCAKQHTMKELANIDSLAYVNPFEAMVLLEDIDSTRLSSPETKAYHILLSTRLQHEIYGINLNIDTINYSIEYYKTTGDSAHAAESYHYKAAVLCFSGDTAKAVENWKKAEKILPNQHDSLKQEILDRLFKVAFDRRDTMNMRKYARVIQNEADLYHNRMWTANDRIIHARGIMYNAIIDNNDSSFTNALKAVSLINYKCGSFINNDYAIGQCRYLSNVFDKNSFAYLGDTIIGTFSEEQKLKIEKRIKEYHKTEPENIRFNIQNEKDELTRHIKENIKMLPKVNNLILEEQELRARQKLMYNELEKAIKDSIRADSIIFTYISHEKAIKLESIIKDNNLRTLYDNQKVFRRPYDSQIANLLEMFYSYFKDKHSENYLLDYILHWLC